MSREDLIPGETLFQRTVGALYVHPHYRGKWHMTSVRDGWITLRSLEVRLIDGGFSTTRLLENEWPGGWQVST